MMSNGLLARYESLVLRVARVVLVLLATGSFVAMVVVLIWLLVPWISPTKITYSEFMDVPAYETLKSAWKSPVESTPELPVNLPPVFEETVETIDSLYQLIGRAEPKFSETEDQAAIYISLLQPFETIKFAELYTTEFLIELKSYVQHMAEDELLKRIANSKVRTTTILDSIYAFRDHYHTNLLTALDNSEVESAKHSRERMVTSVLGFQILSILVAAFVVSAVCLLGFYVVSHRYETSSSITLSTNQYED